MSIDVTLIKCRENLGKWLNRAGLTGVGVEVGTFYGEYMEAIMNHWDGKMLHCIDPWDKQPRETYKEPTNDNDWGEIYRACKWRADKFPGRVNLIRDYSIGANIQFEDESLDFVYIDGNHGLDFIRWDLKIWWPKVKPGGLFCGHDFYDDTVWPSNCSVKTAVEEFMLGRHQPMHLTPKCGSWWVVK